MSLWRERLEIFLGPDRVHVQRFKRGVQDRVGSGRMFPCDLEAPGASSPALDALRRGLRELKLHSADAHVTLSNHLVRYAVVPHVNTARDHAERLALAHHHFTSVYREKADAWRLTLDRADRRGCALAAAVDAGLIEELIATLRSAKLRPSSIEPFLSYAFNSSRRAMAGKPAWLAVAEPGRVCIAYIHNGEWRSLRNQRVTGALCDELLRLLEQSRLADELSAAPTTVYLVAREEQPFSFPQASGWTLQSLPPVGPIGEPAWSRAA